MNTSRFLLAALVALLTACGGGGGEDEQAANETNKPAWDCSYGGSQRIGGEVPRACR